MIEIRLLVYWVHVRHAGSTYDNPSHLKKIIVLKDQGKDNGPLMVSNIPKRSLMSYLPTTELRLEEQSGVGDK